MHEKAGCKKIYEIHGSVYRNYCTKCNKFYDADYVFKSKGVPKCSCGGVIKPDVVLYGESLGDDFINGINVISKASLLIVAGSSLTVEPASSMIRYFNGKNLVIINYDRTPYDYMASLVINDDITKVFEQLK